MLGDAPDPMFRAAGERYRRHGFTDFKIKLSGDLDRDREKCAWLRTQADHGIRARADANNLWNSDSEAIDFLRCLDYDFHAVEEPLRAGRIADMARVADALGCPIVLDESVAGVEQIKPLGAAPERWVVNLRVSKMGGLRRSLSVVEAVRRLRLGLVVGAQVGETSLLTRAGLTVAAAAQDLVVAQEGAFGTMLLSRDICEPPLMFGHGGALDVAQHPALAAPGLGVTDSPLAVASAQAGWEALDDRASAATTISSVTSEKSSKN